MDKIAIIGAGAFGTAIAAHLSDKFAAQRREIVLWARRPEVAEEIRGRHQNSDYTGTFRLPENLQATDSLERAVRESRYIVLAVPTQAVRGMVAELKPFITRTVLFINLAKGLEKKSFKIVSQVVTEAASGCGKFHVTSLSGPSFAKDILARRPVGTTVGGKRWEVLHEIRKLFDTPLFDVKIVRDIIGVETGGALKNVFAIMAGMIAGLDMGPSIQGDFLTRSLVDMKTIAAYMGASRATFNGRSGLGDLDITCTEGSRNFRFGRQYVRCFDELADSNRRQTENFHDEVLAATFERLGTRTVEGYYTLEPLHSFCHKKNMFVPIIGELYKVLYGHSKTPEQAVHDYRRRDKIRAREERLVVSRILNFLFPRLWYRRERGVWATLLNSREQQALESLEDSLL